MKKTLSVLLALCMILLLFPHAAAAQPEELCGDEWDVLFLTNRQRLDAGLQPVTATSFLQDGSGIRAREIMELFEHTRPNGKGCFTVLNEVDAPIYAAVGENIAAGYRSAQDVLDGWMNSPGHRANILQEAFVHMGAGCNVCDDVYHSYWTQLFFSAWGCKYTGMELLPPDTTVFPVGTGIDEMRLTAVLTCRACGTTYLPVMEDLCTGFQPDQAGTQTVTMSCMGQSMEFTVTLVGEGDTGTETLQFGDVPTDAWFVDAVRYVSENELMQGTSGKRFDPNGTMTRAMLVTVLWRYAGRPESGSSHFTDVPEGEWYAKAVAWAAEEGIVRGVTRDIFDPAGNVTREQMAAILYRYTSKTGSDTSARGDLSGFVDQSAMETYAVEAMRWAVAEGIIHGTVKGGQLCLLPKGNATRAEVATILMRYIEDFLK